MVSRAVVDMRDQAGDRIRAVREEQLLVHPVWHSRAAGDSALRRRLGSARGTRLAVLEGTAAGVHFAVVRAGSPVALQASSRIQIELLQQVLTVSDDLLVINPDV